MRKQAPRQCQIGKYWLSKKPGRDGINDPWHRTWYEGSPIRQTRRENFGTPDYEEASRMLAEWVRLNDLPRDGRPDRVTIRQVLDFYWEDKAKSLPSERTLEASLDLWKEWWGDRTVDAVTSQTQKEFRAWLGQGVLRPSTIDKLTSVGSAALKYGVAHRILQSAPQIFSIESKGEKEARPPLGRPLSVEEIAAFFDAIKDAHVMTFTMILANTLSRSAAIFDLKREQFDAATNRLVLNPPNRPQTKKRRPTLPVTPSLRPWLNLPMRPNEHYVTYQGEPLRSIDTAWRTAVGDAGLSGKVNRYSFRHGIARLMRRRGIVLDDIGTFTGHSHTGSNATTAIYVPDDPNYLAEAANAIEGIMQDVRKLLKRANIDDPHSSYQYLQSIQRRVGNHLADSERNELVAMIRAGRSAGEIRKVFGVSYEAVYRYMRKMGLK